MDGRIFGAVNTWATHLVHIGNSGGVVGLQFFGCWGDVSGHIYPALQFSAQSAGTFVFWTLQIFVGG